MAKRILLLRHASLGPDWSGKLLGATDASLDVVGRKRAEAAGELLRSLRADRLWASPMRRCLETAQLAFGSQEFHVDPDLREIDFGRGEGKSFAQFAQEEPGLAERWAEFRDDFAFPGGESVSGFCGRVARAAERLAASAAETVLTITHGGVIRAMLCHYLGLDAKHYLLFDVDYLGLAEIRLFGPRGVLTRLDNSLGALPAREAVNG